MSINEGLRFAYLTYFSQPPCDRPLYRTIRSQRVRRIVEFGIGLGERAEKMIQAASLFSPVTEVLYTGIDLFEARSSYEGPGLTLKMAHRKLKSTGARIQLLPGDSVGVLARSANELLDTDLVIISDRQDKVSWESGWFFVPRMLHEGSSVFVEHGSPKGGSKTLTQLGAQEIDSLASASRIRRAA